jgi:hypothetical protein
VSVAIHEIEAVLIQLEHVSAILLRYRDHFHYGGEKFVGKRGVDIRYWHAVRMIECDRIVNRLQNCLSLFNKSKNLAAVTVSQTPCRTSFWLGFSVMSSREVTN